MTNKQDAVPLKEYIFLLILAALWGGSFTFIKVALEAFPPMTIVMIRMFFGGAILLIIALARCDKFPTTSRNWAELLIQGSLQGALPFFLITWGEQYLDSSTAGVINSTPPMFVFIITVFILQSAKFDPQKFVGILFGISGVALIASSQGHAVSSNNSLAVLAVFGASFSYASGAIFGRRFSDQSVFVTASTSLMLASLLISPIVLIFEPLSNLTFQLEPSLALLALTLLSTALASLIYFRLIKTLGSLATTSNAYLRALFSIVFGVIFLSESFNSSLIIATILIFFGVFMVTGQFRNLVTNKIITQKEYDKNG
ncbi:DMT family transporter [Marinomonas sp. TI.3.20]|uniref:DMT family transporter n=1 Tax=Marinomonas sp. TI.3.20 TaxID=3121296 RepID=UPI00311E64EB